MPIVIIWHSTLSLVKISLLLLYIRLFSVKSKHTQKKHLTPFQIAAYAGIVVVACFFVMVILEETLICRPLRVNWEPEATDAVCGNGRKAYIATGVINVLTDVWVIGLPIPQIWSLQMPRRSKVVLSVLFSMGLVYVHSLFTFLTPSRRDDPSPR